MSDPRSAPGPDSTVRTLRRVAATGAAFCAMAVAIGAAAMHASLASHDRERLAIAALFLFGHGIALAALAPSARSRKSRIGLYVVLSGTILFSGSLVLAAAFGIEPKLAPLGGGSLMFGWLLLAVGYLFD
jgi:uncharacterized membrane protein YgdD (TMEM256/DUF423 family)